MRILLVLCLLVGLLPTAVLAAETEIPHTDVEYIGAADSEATCKSATFNIYCQSGETCPSLPQSGLFPRKKLPPAPQSRRQFYDIF